MNGFSLHIEPPPLVNSSYNCQRIDIGLNRSYAAVDCLFFLYIKVSKGAMIRNPYNQVPHLTLDYNGKVTNSQLYTTDESQEVSPCPSGDHKAQINSRAKRHNKHKTEKT